MLACFLGGFIGTLVAKNLGFFWWIGLIAGGFVGFLSYEFKAVIIACKNAWKAVIGIRITKEQWQKFENHLKLYFQDWFSSTMGLYGTIVIGVMLVLCLTDTKYNWVGVGMVMAFFFLCSFLTAYLLFELDVDKKTRKSLLRWNPVRIYCWIVPKYIFLGVVYLIKHTPKFIAEIVKTILRFTKHVFIEIHSEIRLLCGIDAAIGVCIGFFTGGNALIGGIAGAIFGGLNYEIISKRILHLVPIKK